MSRSRGRNARRGAGASRRLRTGLAALACRAAAVLGGAGVPRALRAWLVALACLAALTLDVRRAGAGAAEAPVAPPPAAVETDEDAGPEEPPSEAPEGEDYEIAPADSLAAGTVEVGFGAAGRAGGGARRRRRVRFRDDDLSGEVREGAGDPLAGATMEGRGAGGALTVGRLAPRWGRGLLLGAPAQPWSAVALDRGGRAAFRGRSGEGVDWRASGAIGIEALLGRFARRGLAGLRLAAGDAALGAVAGGGREIQAGASLARGAFEAEAALDRAGRWRAEGASSRALGSRVIVVRVRGGLAGFRSLAEPGRSGPAQALSIDLHDRDGPTALGAIGALWRFAPGQTGARAALRLAHQTRRGGAFACGIEEQHGVRRPPTSATAARARFRQGAWGEWRGGPPQVALVLRHETWGERPFARAAVRVATAARVEIAAPLGARLRVAHTAYRTRRGESLYLPESGSDRLVLRALSGAGERTRIELRVPLAGGVLDAAVALTRASGVPRAQWTLDWRKRARVRG